MSRPSATFTQSALVHEVVTASEPGEIFLRTSRSAALRACLMATALALASLCVLFL